MSSASVVAAASSLTGRVALDRVRALPPIWLQRLKEAGLTTLQDVFSMTELDLMERLDLHMSEVLSLLSLVAQYGLPRPATAFDLRERSKQAGVAVAFVMDERAPSTQINSGITEICGPPGLGKTQWCFGLCAKAFMPVSAGGLGGGTYWIDTEGAFSTDRLVEIAQRRFPDYFNTRERVRQLIGDVQMLSLVGQADAHKALLATLMGIETVLVEKGCKLLILDGIAATVRSQTDRTEVLGQIASALKLLSESLQISVFVTNQVTTKFGQTGKDDGTIGVRSDAHLVAALGVGWAHAVNTRFLLEMSADDRRTLRVAKSPMFPCDTFTYEIDERGATVVQSSSVAAPTGSVLDMAMRRTHHMTIGTRMEQ